MIKLDLVKDLIEGHQQSTNEDLTLLSGNTSGKYFNGLK